MESGNKNEVLYLTIMKVFFDQIISGKKVEEFREPTDYWFRRLFIIEDNTVIKPKPFKYARFCVGYHKDREEALVEIKDIGYYEFVDYIPEGFEKGDEAIVIQLGKILSTKLKNK